MKIITALMKRNVCNGYIRNLLELYIKVLLKFTLIWINSYTISTHQICVCRHDGRTETQAFCPFSTPPVSKARLHDIYGRTIEKLTLGLWQWRNPRRDKYQCIDDRISKFECVLRCHLCSSGYSLAHTRTYILQQNILCIDIYLWPMTLTWHSFLLSGIANFSYVRCKHFFLLHSAWKFMLEKICWT
jgi:hypothetical protein